MAVSSALVEYVTRQAPGATVRHIPNGADVEAFARARDGRAPVDRTEVIIGFAGSMKPWHGVDHLIDAFAHLRETRSPARLVLAGHGPEEPALRDRVAGDPRLQPYVQFLGAVPHHEMPGILVGFDIGAAPYTASEDFYFSPLKVVEYLAAGLPVVYPRIGDLPDLVADAGIGYDPGNPDALRCALAELARDSDLRAAHASAAALRAPGLSWDATARRIEDLLQQLAASGTRTSR
jgi:glycosyltransferase involved in cell wall biosynthesis